MERFSLFRDPDGTLVFVDERGRRITGVEPVRMFPLTDPDRWISLCDSEAKELVCIEDLADLSPEIREVVTQELAAREFLPVIKRIIKISTRSEPSQWQVETDRGETTFIVKDEDDVHRLEGSRMLVIDIHGTRYLIPDVYRLDSASRKNLAHFL